MKKLLMASAVALFGLMSAQEYKPVAGDVTVDLGISGGLGNTSVSLPDQGFGAGTMFKARYFVTDKFAYRGTLFVANQSETDNATTNTVVKDNTFGLGLGFGAEKHFTGTERLSPYVGGDIMIGFASNNTKSTVSVPNTTPVITETKGPNNFRAGIRGVFGADYYFAKRVFLGVEAGLGLIYESEGDVTYKVTGLPDTKIEGGDNFTIAPAVVTGIRLGYAF